MPADQFGNRCVEQRQRLARSLQRRVALDRFGLLVAQGNPGGMQPFMNF